MSGAKCARMKGFREFILRGNLVDLAVAVVIGAAFGALVSAFVADLVTPIIAAIGGEPDFSSLSFTINGSKFLYGHFINALLTFLIIAAVVYFFVVKPVAALLERLTPKKEVGEQRECPECLSDIPIGASRCSFCTAQVTPVAPSG
jgi:large conductance mechanosensitive channel